jgi:hypothetical protein
MLLDPSARFSLVPPDRVQSFRQLLLSGVTMFCVPRFTVVQSSIEDCNFVFTELHPALYHPSKRNRSTFLPRSCHGGA